MLVSHLSAVYCLAKKRRQLRVKKRRSQNLMLAAKRGLVASQVNGDVRADHSSIEDRYPSDAAQGQRPPRSTGMSSPLIEQIT
jgi:hypothetical protein